MAAQPFLFPFLLLSLFFFKRQTTCREIRISRGKPRALIGLRNTSPAPPTGFDTFRSERSEAGGSALKGKVRGGARRPGGCHGLPSSPPPPCPGWGVAMQMLTLGLSPARLCWARLKRPVDGFGSRVNPTWGRGAGKLGRAERKGVAGCAARNAPFGGAVLLRWPLKLAIGGGLRLLQLRGWRTKAGDGDKAPWGWGAHCSFFRCPWNLWPRKDLGTRSVISLLAGGVCMAPRDA